MTDQAAVTHRCDALTDLDDRSLGRCATVDGLFDTPEPQPRPWRLLGAQPSGPLAVALDRPITDQSHLNRYFPGSEALTFGPDAV